MLLVNRLFNTYERERFGEPGFGDKIMNWVEQNYSEHTTFGAPFTETKFCGMTLMAREKNVSFELTSAELKKNGN